MADPTEQVVVLRVHLEELEDVLRRAHGYFSSQDLADSFRTGSAFPPKNRISVVLAQQLDRIAGYLEEEE